MCIRDSYKAALILIYAGLGILLENIMAFVLTISACLLYTSYRHEPAWSWRPERSAAWLLAAPDKRRAAIHSRRNGRFVRSGA